MILRQRSYMGEAKKKKPRSQKAKGGKYKYKGKVGVWRTLENGDRVFFPDDESGPMAMRKVTKQASVKQAAKGKAKGKGQREIQKAISDKKHRKEVGKSAAESIKKNKDKAVDAMKKSIEDTKGAKEALKKASKEKAVGKKGRSALGKIATVMGAALVGALAISMAPTIVSALATAFVGKALLQGAGRIMSDKVVSGMVLMEADEEMEKFLTNIIDYVIQQFDKLGNMSDDEIQKILEKEAE